MIDLPLLYPCWEAPDSILAFVTTRSGGTSQAPFSSFNLADHVGDNAEAVVLNRLRLRDKFSWINEWQWLNQMHGARVVVIQSKINPVMADAVITREAGLALSILTADCLPLLLASEDGSEIAAVHCGWRGLAAGIVANTIQAMATPPDAILAWMGPAIGPCHFEVGQDVHDSLSAVLSSEALASAFVPGADEKFMANLYEIGTALLQQQGVLRITGGKLCTACDQQRFFSYRLSPICGRIASTICIQPALSA